MGGAELGSRATKSEPNVVPLCDILLVLLIIFMVITPISQKGLDVKIPETEKELPPTPDPRGIVLTMENNRTIKLNTEPVSMDMLSVKLREIYAMRPDKTIFIRADESLPYAEVVKMADIARGAGVDVLGIICERYQTKL